MYKKSAISVIGFAIVIVILLGVAMIISAPSVLETSSKENENKMTERNDMFVKLQEFENDINNRLINLENNINTVNNSQADISNKYICTIVGNVDRYGNIVKIDSSNGLTKFMFMCEYKP